MIYKKSQLKLLEEKGKKKPPNQAKLQKIIDSLKKQFENVNKAIKFYGIGRTQLSPHEHELQFNVTLKKEQKNPQYVIPLKKKIIESTKQNKIIINYKFILTNNDLICFWVYFKEQYDKKLFCVWNSPLDIHINKFDSVKNDKQNNSNEKYLPNTSLDNQKKNFLAESEIMIDYCKKKGYIDLSFNYERDPNKYNENEKNVYIALSKESIFRSIKGYSAHLGYMIIYLNGHGFKTTKDLVSYAVKNEKKKEIKIKIEKSDEKKGKEKDNNNALGNGENQNQKGNTIEKITFVELMKQWKENTSETKLVLLLDACYSGNWALELYKNQEQYQEYPICIICSCLPNTYSYVGNFVSMFEPNQENEEIVTSITTDFGNQTPLYFMNKKYKHYYDNFSDKTQHVKLPSLSVEEYLNKYEYLLLESNQELSNNYKEQNYKNHLNELLKSKHLYLFEKFNNYSKKYTLLFEKRSEKSPQKCYAELIDVDSGDCMVLYLFGVNVMIDTGTKLDETNIKQIQSFFKPKEYKDETIKGLIIIDHLILTHLHDDHIGGVVDTDSKNLFKEKFKVTNVHVRNIFTYEFLPDHQSYKYTIELEKYFHQMGSKINSKIKPKKLDIFIFKTINCEEKQQKQKKKKKATNKKATIDLTFSKNFPFKNNILADQTLNNLIKQKKNIEKMPSINDSSFISEIKVNDKVSFFSSGDLIPRNVDWEQMKSLKNIKIPHHGSLSLKRDMKKFLNNLKQLKNSPNIFLTSMNNHGLPKFNFFEEMGTLHNRIYVSGISFVIMYFKLLYIKNGKTINEDNRNNLKQNNEDNSIDNFKKKKKKKKSHEWTKIKNYFEKNQQQIILPEDEDYYDVEF